MDALHIESTQNRPNQAENKTNKTPAKQPTRQLCAQPPSTYSPLSCLSCTFQKYAPPIRTVSYLFLSSRAYRPIFIFNKTGRAWEGRGRLLGLVRLLRSSSAGRLREREGGRVPWPPLRLEGARGAAAGLGWAGGVCRPLRAWVRNLRRCKYECTTAMRSPYAYTPTRTGGALWRRSPSAQARKRCWRRTCARSDGDLEFERAWDRSTKVGADTPTTPLILLFKPRGAKNQRICGLFTTKNGLVSSDMAESQGSLGQFGPKKHGGATKSVAKPAQSHESPRVRKRPRTPMVPQVRVSVPARYVGSSRLCPLGTDR